MLAINTGITSSDLSRQQQCYFIFTARPFCPRSVLPARGRRSYSYRMTSASRLQPQAAPDGSSAGQSQQQQAVGTNWLWHVWTVMKTGAVLALFLATLVVPSADYTWPAAWFVLFAASMLVLLPCFLYIRAHNPDLIQEREKGIRHRNIAGFDIPLVAAAAGLIPVRLVAAGAQHLWQLQQPGWSPTPFLSTPAQLAAAAVLVFSCLLQTWSVCTNRYFSSVVRIQTDRGHKVCSSGPYAWVRHPGYVAFSLQGVAESVLLESSWAMVFALIKIVVLLVRTVKENAFLKASLPGYAAYAERVRYSWVPFLW